MPNKMAAWDTAKLAALSISGEIEVARSKDHVSGCMTGHSINVRASGGWVLTSEALAIVNTVLREETTYILQKALAVAEEKQRAAARSAIKEAEAILAEVGRHNK